MRLKRTYTGPATEADVRARYYHPHFGGRDASANDGEWRCVHNTPSDAVCEPVDLLPVTLQWCDHCQSEGRIIRARAAPYWSFDPEEVDLGECPFCEGTGGALIATESATESEIMEEQG